MTNPKFAQQLSPDERYTASDDLLSALRNARDEAEACTDEETMEELRCTLESALADAYDCCEDDGFQAAGYIADALVAGLTPEQIIECIDTAIDYCEESFEYINELRDEEERWERRQANAAYYRDCTMAAAW